MEILKIDQRLETRVYRKNEGVVSKETVVLRPWGSIQKFLVLSTELIIST